MAVDGDTAVVGAYGDDKDAITASSGSVYVFTRDNSGVWRQAANLRASDAAVGDRFGWSVAVDGDTVVAGAYGDDGANVVAPDSGSVYVFTKPSDGWDQWDDLADDAKTQLTAKLAASDAAAGDRFGVSVAVDGDHGGGGGLRGRRRQRQHP